MKKFLQKLPFVKKRGPRVAVLRLSGVIASQGRFGQGLSLSGVAGPLEHAFDLPHLKAVALVVNSPGGSPVQSSLIFKRIRALADEKGIPVFAFVEDVAASGGYYISVAADEIFADESSIVGSIGVISAGFGFDKAIEKFGIERRIYTAGENKATLDPFQPENEADIKRLLAMQKEVHTTFKTVVRERRGDRLAKDDDSLFSGEFWAGTQAVNLGLIDGIGDLRTVMRRRFGKKVRLEVVTRERPLWKKAIPFASRAASNADPAQRLAKSFGADMASELLEAVETRALWSRFGL